MVLTRRQSSLSAEPSPSKHLDQLWIEVRRAQFASMVASHAVGLLIASEPLSSDTSTIIRRCWKDKWSSYSVSARSAIPFSPREEVVSSIKVDIKNHFKSLFRLAGRLLLRHFDFWPSSSHDSAAHNSALASRILKSHRFAHAVNSDTAAPLQYQHDIIQEFIESAWFGFPAHIDAVEECVYVRVVPYFKDDTCGMIPHVSIALVLTIIEITLTTKYLNGGDHPYDILVSPAGREWFARNLKAVLVWETSSALSGISPNFATVRAQWFDAIARQYGEL